MKWRTATGLAVILGVVVSGCTGEGFATNSTAPTTTISTVIPPSTFPPVVDCPGAGDFGEGGGIAEVDGEGSDSNNLGQISWESAEPCESFHFAFETSEGAPATTVPDIRIDHLESFQVIRISMGIGAAVVTDQLVETGLVDRLYVVRALDGAMFVDLHLAAPAAARARVESSPAVLTVDLRPGFVQFDGAATVHDSTVVVSPSTGALVDPLTTISGYARVPDAEVGVIVTQGDTVVTSTRTTAADSSATWGEFRAEVSLPPGDVTVFVGEDGDQGEGPEGVSLDLTVS